MVRGFSVSRRGVSEVIGEDSWIQNCVRDYMVRVKAEMLGWYSCMAGKFGCIEILVDKSPVNLSLRK